MPEQQQKSKTDSKKQSYEDLVRELADRVYKLWERELRYERERKGGKGN